MSLSGYNPLRWRCDESGCFNVKRRPKIEVLGTALPGKNAFGDVDAVAEIGGRFLFLEFKSGTPRDLPYGQRLLFERLTALSPKITVVVACADAETMAVTHLCTVRAGRFSRWEAANLDDLIERIGAWADRAINRHPAPELREAS